MRRYIKPAFFAVLACSALIGIVSWVALSPAIPFENKSEIEPAKVVLSKPNAQGLVTASRPLVTHITTGDPLGIAIHWQRPNGPIGVDDELADRRHETPFLPLASINTMTFVVKCPDNTVFRGKISVPQEPRDGWYGLFYRPTIYFELNRDGVEAQPESGHFPWLDGAKLECDAYGVYRVHIEGKIVRDGAADIAFASEPVSIERKSGINSLSTLRFKSNVAASFIWKKWFLGDEGVVVDDAQGNRSIEYALGGHKWWYWIGTLKLRPDGAVLGTEKQEKTSCIAVGTLVTTPHGETPIDSLRVGDTVIGMDLESGGPLKATVFAIRRHRASETVLINNRLRITSEHPIWANGEWVQAGRLKVGDGLLDAEGRPQVVTVLESLSGDVDVFDISVDGPHNFIAGKVLVHNKDIVYSPKSDDPWYSLPDVPPP